MAHLSDDGREEDAPLDVHGDAIRRGFVQGIELMASLSSDSPLEDLDQRIDGHLDRLDTLFARHDAIEVIEQARLAALPWSWKNPAYQAGVENGFSVVELLSVVAMTSASRGAHSSEPAVSVIDEGIRLIEELFDMGMLRSVVVADPEDPLALVRANIHASELMIRGSSYRELIEETNQTLFDSNGMGDVVRAVCGFSFAEAADVLNTIHDLQVGNTQRRVNRGVADLERAQQLKKHGGHSIRYRKETASYLNFAMNPNAAAASVSSADLQRATGLSADTINAVLLAFSWTPNASQGVKEHARSFLSGNNPFRSTPILRTLTGRAMLAHPVLTQDALRETLEAKLRASSAWEKYQKHRGEVLEARTRKAIERLMSPTQSWHGLNYYVPATPAEEGMAPLKYTKRVESDHLILVDDIALIIEDKAVALSSLSRSGLASRLKKDLAGIITKAASQADRLVQRIAADGGIRTNGEGWLDLQHIKEVHTIAVSLDDLGPTTTATADLVQAGLINSGSIPWTVSIHDLDLIAELTSRPAEFLLYLRRRRHPLATVQFSAPDELDLYLFFLHNGLYVEEDPDQLRSLFQFLPPKTQEEEKTWAGQVPVFVTSQTDSLDAWCQERFLQQRAGRQPRPNAAKRPSRTVGPMEAMLDQIDELDPFAKVSIGATLLTGASETQTLMSRYGLDILRRARIGREGRMQTVPIATPDDGGWVMVWAIQPSPKYRAVWEREMRAYLRAKGHQLGVQRAVLFAYDGHKSELSAVYYEAIPSELDPSAKFVSPRLFPLSQPDSATVRLQGRHGQRAQPVRKKRKR